MFFGLCNSPATFQSMMNEVFRDLIYKDKVLIYMDNILVIGGKTEEEHAAIIDKIIKLAEENDLYFKGEKCEFFKKEINLMCLIS